MASNTAARKPEAMLENDYCSVGTCRTFIIQFAVSLVAIYGYNKRMCVLLNLSVMPLYFESPIAISNNWYLSWNGFVEQNPTLNVV